MQRRARPARATPSAETTLPSRLASLLLLALLLPPHRLLGQAVAVTISGRVQDAQSKAAIPFLVVQLRTERDSALVGGRLTDATGAFSFSGLTKGTYLLDGRNCADLNDEDLSALRGRKIGFVFQAFNLIPELTVLENVEVPLFYQGVPKAERRRRAENSLRLVGLGDRMEHRPRQLSGGQQQRTAIARALVTDPVILMADEPTGNLDSTTGEQILNLIETLHAGGMTIVMVTHDDRISARCERIVRLKDGLTESDTLTARGRELRGTT